MEMNLNTTWPSRGMASNPVLKAGLILFAALAFVLAVSGQARAADCATPDACYNAAAWQKAIADDYSKKAFFAGADAQNNFRAAADWHNKSVAAFLSGDGNAAGWYQAIANDYARKAAASATAANDFAAKAKFTRAAGDANVARALQLTAFFFQGPTAQEEAADAQAAGVEPDTTAVAAGTTAPERCKNPGPRTWEGNGIHFTANPSGFCYRKPSSVTQLTVSISQDVTGAANATILTDGCKQDRSWYNWRGHGPNSGRKVLVTCTWKTRNKIPLIPVSSPFVAKMDCRAALYFHGDGSYGYTKSNKARCGSFRPDIDP
jgi:hypothetical protein